VGQKRVSEDQRFQIPSLKLQVSRPNADCFRQNPKTGKINNIFYMPFYVACVEKK
jgi:hypothetical protein